mmetsp:Transcript_1696/g.6403  ORF Transcript_1696/g.6403 Transcript_1696/m.6403 type:complete len:290 (+) Transcript_1696:6101-6970(+)
MCGSSLISAVAPSRRQTNASGTYRPLLSKGFFNSKSAAWVRNAVPPPSPLWSSISSKHSKLRCVSLTVCDKGSSQFAHRMAETRCESSLGNKTSTVKVSCPVRVLCDASFDEWSTPEPALVTSAFILVSADFKAAAAWNLWCESTGFSKESHSRGTHPCVSTNQSGFFDFDSVPGRTKNWLSASPDAAVSTPRTALIFPNGVNFARSFFIVVRCSLCKHDDESTASTHEARVSLTSVQVSPETSPEKQSEKNASASDAARRFGQTIPAPTATAIVTPALTPASRESSLP